jgi:hypothetical protein
MLTCTNLVFKLIILFLYSTKSPKINNKFNLLSNLVPLMGPRRLIPMVKTQYTHWEKPIFWVNKNPQGKCER